MPHADAAYVPSGLSKPEFWNHVHDQLAPLLEGQRNWVKFSHSRTLISSDRNSPKMSTGHQSRKCIFVDI